MRISDWSSDVCSSDLHHTQRLHRPEPDTVEDAGLANNSNPKAAPQPSRSPAPPERHRFEPTESVHAERSPHEPRDVYNRRRSEERRVGKECVRTCGSRRSRYNLKKKKLNHKHS